MTRYADEAEALDAEILHAIDSRSVPDFNDLALRIFAHQLRYNEPYARYCDAAGVRLDSLPASWKEIPPVPAFAFKEAALCTFDPRRAELVFETSGTTLGLGGRHYMESSKLYEAALLAGFGDAVASRSDRPLRYVLLVANPAQQPSSSLGYMMAKVAASFGDGRETWCVDESVLRADRFAAAIADAAAANAPVCVAATAFVLVQLFDELTRNGRPCASLPPGSIVMETGGFKGKTRTLHREALYRDIVRWFAIEQDAIVGEYGMTELSSQYYDDAQRIKRAPPWLRPRIVAANGDEVPTGTAGAIIHVDLANRSSCVAVQTEDVGIAADDDGVILIGRETHGDPRGCSLDAEALSTRS